MILTERFYHLATVTLILLLCALPILFRKPAGTVESAVEIAFYAQILSHLDSANTVTEPDYHRWANGTGFKVLDCTPLLTSDNIVSGNHEYYPYRLTTLRDVETQSILIFLSSPAVIPPGNIYTLPNGREISIRTDGDCAVMLLGSTDSDLLSGTYLSIIDN